MGREEELGALNDRMLLQHPNLSCVSRKCHVECGHDGSIRESHTR